MSKTIILLCICIFVSYSRGFSEESKTLKFVQIIFRHGDRAPVELYPNDPNPESVWPEGLGQLTPLGKKQHYALGKYFANVYKSFFTANPNEVDVLSSGEARCIASAEAHMAGFFHHNSNNSVDKNLRKLIEIHFIPKAQDKYLDIGSYCPRDDVEYRKMVSSPEGQKLNSEHKTMFQNISFYSGYPVTNFVSASEFFDIISVEQNYNLIIPQWIEPFRDELEHVMNMSYYFEFLSIIRQRLRAGPFFGLLNQKMIQKTSGTLPNLKFQVYSSHDVNIAAVLVSLKLFDKMKPPFASAVLFELHGMSDGVDALRILYQNSSRPEEHIDPPHTLILEGCSEFCPLEYFLNYTKRLIPEEWDEECQIGYQFY